MISNNLNPIPNNSNPYQTGSANLQKTSSPAAVSDTAPKETQASPSANQSGIILDLSRSSMNRGMTNEDLLERVSARTAAMPAMTPTFHMVTAREFTVEYKEAVTIGVDGKRDGAIVKYFDTTKDEDYPGRYFINTKSFLDDAIELYQSDSAYLDNPKAWLPQEIKRYSQDIMRFFGYDPNDTGLLEAQIIEYIKQSANPESSVNDANDMNLTIGDVNFSISDFKSMITILNTALKEETHDHTTLLNDVKESAKDFLNDAQINLLLSRDGSFAKYSEWAKFYGHDEKAFLYS